MTLVHSPEGGLIPTEGREPPVVRSRPIAAITKREIIRQVPASFERQYGDHREARSWKGDTTRGEMIDALNALDTETCTAAEINEIIGNTSWTENKCDGCDQDADILIRLGDEPDHDSRWLDLCPTCLTEAGEFAARVAAQSPTEQVGQ